MNSDRPRHLRQAAAPAAQFNTALEPTTDSAFSLPGSVGFATRQFGGGSAFVRWADTVMRLVILVALMCCTAAKGNPAALALRAEDRIYMASEHLTATITPDVADFSGTFTFRYRQDVPSPGQKSFVMLEIPIWFPEANPRDPSVGEFWKTFRRDDGTELTPQKRAAFEKAVGLHVALGGEPLPVKQFSTLTSTNRMQRWAPHEWQEPGFCCLVFGFYFTDDSVLTQKLLTISYKQPLDHANEPGRFFYLPVFKNLPEGSSTGDTNRYSITIVAQPGCSLTVTSGDTKSRVDAGNSVVLSPRHHQAIRATVTTRPNKIGAANSRRAGQSSDL